MPFAPTRIGGKANTGLSLWAPYAPRAGLLPHRRQRADPDAAGAADREARTSSSRNIWNEELQDLERTTSSFK